MPRDRTRLKELELKYRGLALEDGLWEAAEALARQVGADEKPSRLRWDSSQFPFERALTLQLRKMEARYGGLLEAAPDAMIVTNGHGEILLINAQAERVFGYERDELLGKAVTTIVEGGLMQSLVADGVEAADGLTDQDATTGIELTGLRRDGSQFPVEAMLSLVTDDDGTLVTAAIRNVSARKASERQLLRMEARARGLLDAAPDPMIVVNKRGRIVEANARTLEVFGYDREAVVGEPANLLVPEGLTDRLLAHATLPIDEALAQSAGTPFDLAGRRRDGSEFPLELTMAPAQSAEGIMAVVIMRETASRRAGRGPGGEVEDRYRSYLEAAPEAIAVVDQVGDIVFFNPEAERRFGYDRDEVTGRSITALIPEGFAERLTVDPLVSLEVALAQQIGTGIELTGWRKDGTQFPLEVMLSPLETPRGTLVVATMRDISVRKAAERHAQEKEASKFEALLAAVSDAVLVGDGEGRIRDANAAAEVLFGYGPGELAGKSLLDLLPAPDQERSAAGSDILRVLAAADPGAQAQRADGTRFPADLSILPADTPNGRLVFVAIRNALPRRTAAEAVRVRESLERNNRELSRANEDLLQFAHVAANNLKEPLRLIGDPIEVLLRHYRSRLEGDAANLLDRIANGARRMETLIGDLLAYCQLGAAGPNRTATPMDRVCEAATRRLAPAITTAGAVITHDALPAVMGDPAELTTLFHNLFANAIGYRGAEPPRIHVSAEQNPAGEWVFSVADNGIGIERQYFERIFMLFQRLHRPEEHPGTGVGLALCRKIAEQHGGRMWVESQPGLGSTFFLALPGAEV